MKARYRMSGTAIAARREEERWWYKVAPKSFLFSRSAEMNSIIYLVGLVVVIMAVVSFVT
jgi:hypothetical protein